MRIRVKTTGINNKVDILWGEVRRKRVDFVSGLGSAPFQSGIVIRIISVKDLKIICKCLADGWQRRKSSPVDVPSINESSKNDNSTVTERFRGRIPPSFHELRRVVEPHTLRG